MNDASNEGDGRLLLLDDDAGILRLQRKRLEAAGYSTTAVQTTAAAREELGASHYELLVLDYRLEAGESGLEFYQSLRAEGCDVPAILVTAFSDESKLFEALRAGVRDVVPKGGEYLEYLPQAVARVMSQIRAEREAVEAQALRRSEGRLRALNAELERSERQLRAQAQELAEANRSKDLFLATLAHELRNPLAPIRFAVQVLRDLSPEQREARDVIERQLLHLVRLVDDLLDVSRISRNIIALKRARVELEPIMRAAVESVGPDLAAIGHHLVFLPAPPGTWLDADAARLMQVFTNLLHNAVKYAGPDGHIKFAAEVSNSSVSVYVSDTGAGIAPEDLDRVFDMFYQAPESRHQALGGLGIGLMLVKRLVEMHGGGVEARSEGRGRGAEFTVTLPLVSAPELVQVHPAETSEGGTPGEPMKVLVVDDNVDSAALLALLVEQDGHFAVVAHDGAEALARFGEDGHPRVAFLDIGLPGMSGYEVARRMRAMAGRDVFLVAVTGWGQDEDRQRARDAGFDHHLVKPADPAAISRLLVRISRGEDASTT